ncbi:vitamin K epoxide reductase family protein [Leucobacter sp. USHLN153]|uniref:vitamin K epoxide reductase family protein n=1 Tax=Leucobacter sp. USHLN153 TaxID=3081268 RepID=UPI0030170503
MSIDTRDRTRPVAFAVFTIVAGLVGWFASFELLTEYIKTLQNPDYVPNCSVSILVTCSPNMASWQGSLLGFSNTVLGVAGFVAPIAVGVALLAGARFSAWFWALYQAGLLVAFVFVCWLFAQSVFVIGSLCPWCMIVWSATIPLWWVTFFRAYAVGDIPLAAGARRLFEKLYSWSWVVILVTFAVIAFLAQMRLDWLAEFSRG